MNKELAEDFIKTFISKYGLQFSYNHFNGFKITFNDIEIDLWHTKDLFDSIEYNADGLLYDINNHRFISLTFDDFLKNGPKKINYSKNIDDKSQERLLKLKNFIKN